MDALTALCERVSCSRLTDPAPEGAVLESIFASALRAADHANLRPWKFLVIEKEGRNALGKLFLDASDADCENLSGDERERLAQRPLRAPMVVVAIASCNDNTFVPEVEQIISAGAAVQNMITAAFAQGVGAYWRTGDMTTHPVVEKGLGLTENEQIVGFIYLGTPVGTQKDVPDLAVNEFFSQWPPAE